MCVFTEVVSVVEHLDVRLGDGRFPGELLAEKLFGNRQVAMEKPAHQSQRKHILGAEDRLVVQSAVLEALLAHGGYRSFNHFVLYAEF